MNYSEFVLGLAPESKKKRLASTLQRAVRALSRASGEVGTSAFSLAMLVFLVLEARATALSQDQAQGGEPMDISDLDAVREVFGDSASDQVAGVDYTEIADAVAEISDLYAQEVLAEEAAGAEQGGSDAELDLLDQYLQDAVQYAQLSPGEASVLEAEAAVSGGAATGAGPLAAAAAPGLGLGGVVGGVAVIGGVALLSEDSSSSSSTSSSGTASVATTSASGTVVNGYIKDATVFQDLNNNGEWDSGEPKTTTGDDGTFTLQVVTGSDALLVMTGGKDLSTGLDYSSILKAPPGSTTITPLTTLVAALMESGETEADAKSAVNTAFGLGDNVNLLDFDPVAKADKEGATEAEIDLAIKVKAAGVLVANLMDTGASALAGASGASGDDASALSSTMATAIANKLSDLGSGGMDALSAKDTISSILEESASTAGLTGEALTKFNAVAEAAADGIAAVNKKIDDAVGSDSTAAEKFDAIAKAQKVAQGTLSESINEAAGAGDPEQIPEDTELDTLVEDADVPNNAPLVEGALTAAATEAATSSVTLNLLDGARDLDVGQTAGLSVIEVKYTVEGVDSDTIPAGLSLSDEGDELTIDPTNAAFNALKEGETRTITVSYNISDGKGGTVPQTATITITGAAQTATISLSEAQERFNDGTYYSDDDTVTLSATAADLYTANAAVNDLKTLGVDLIDIAGDGKFHIAAEDAGALSRANVAFVDGDTISVDVSGSYVNGTLSVNDMLESATDGLGLSDLSDLGVDLIDIDGDEVATLHISDSDATAVAAESLAFAADDDIVLDLGDDTTVDYDGTLGSAVLTATGLSLSQLHDLGVDTIDIAGGSAADARISFEDAADMSEAELSFATNDTISLDVTEELGASASYLSGNMSLDDALKSATGGLGLSELSGLGVDFIDIGGDEEAVTLEISVTDVEEMNEANGNEANGAHDENPANDANLAFASEDTIILNVRKQDLDGLNLGNLDALNVDVIDIDGSAQAELSIEDSSHATEVAEAGLKFAEADTITLDVTTDELGASDGMGGSGSYLNGTLDEALQDATGLTLADLKELGVDFIDIGGSDIDATLHISVEDAAVMEALGLQFAEGDSIVTDGVDYSEGSVPAASRAAATEQQNTDFALGADQSLQDLLVALGDSGAVVPVVVGAEADIAVSDSTVSTLLDAGMLSVDTASTIEVDTDAEHMSTSLLQLVDIGTDKVVTSQDKVFVDLGEVADVDQLSTLLSSLLEDSADTDSSTLFVQADGDMVQEVGLVFTADQAALADEIEGNDSLLAQLTHVGITELLVATDDGARGDVQLLGHEYHKQPIA